MTKTRVGVIGAGSWAVSAHIPALAARDDVELVGVCRTGQEALDRLQKTFGFAMASTDYREVLAAGLDAVIVASPSALHHEQAAAALRSGAHVLCEKPMTIDPAEAWDLVRIAEEQNRELLIAFGWNYMPMIHKTLALLREHGIGRPEHLSIHMSSSTRELLLGTGAYPDSSADSAPQQATWTNPALSGGGYGQAQLSHALALALALVPGRVTEVTGRFFGTGTPGVELHDAATLRFASGAVGTLSGGSAHAGAWGDRHDLQVRAIGSEGQLMVDVLREIAWVYRPDSGEHHVPLRPGDGSYQPAGPANALIDIARGLAPNPAPGRLGALTVDALHLLYAEGSR